MSNITWTTLDEGEGLFEEGTFDDRSFHFEVMDYGSVGEDMVSVDLYVAVGGFSDGTAQCFPLMNLSSIEDAKDLCEKLSKAMIFNRRQVR